MRTGAGYSICSKRRIERGPLPGRPVRQLVAPGVALGLSPVVSSTDVSSVSTFQIIVIVVAAQAVTVVLLFTAAIFVQVRKSGTRTRRLHALWSGLVPLALGGSADAIDRLRHSLRSRRARQLFHDFLDAELRRRAGYSSSALRELSRSLGFTAWLEGRMRGSRNLLERAAVAKTLARLQEESARSVALMLLDSRDPAVVLAAGYAVAAFRDPTQLLPVFRAVYDRTPLTLHGAAELLSGFGKEACPVSQGLLQGVVRHLGEGRSSASIDRQREVAGDDTAAQVVLIDLLAFFHYQPALPTLLELLDLTADGEVTIHLVKALAKVGDHRAVPRLVELLGHPDWVIRSQSARALAALGARGACPAIRALCDDENLAVRSAAKAALAALEVVPESQLAADMGLEKADPGREEDLVGGGQVGSDQWD